MSENKITREELRALFGDTMPIEAMKVMFPEHFENGKPSELSVGDVRAELHRIANEIRAGKERGPIPGLKSLKFVGRPVRVSLLKLLLWRIFRRPFGLWLHLDVVIDPANPFVLDRVEPRFAGRDRQAAWDEGFLLTPEPRRVRR